MLVPSLLRDLASRPDLMHRLSESQLQWIVTGAEPVPLAEIETVGREMPGVKITIKAPDGSQAEAALALGPICLPVRRLRAVARRVRH